MLRLRLLGGLFLGAVIGAASATVVLDTLHRSSNANEESRIARLQLGKVDDLSQAFQLTSKAVYPSVVSVSSIRKVASRRLPNELPESLRRFFGDDFDSFNRQQPDRGYEQQGTGSGVIVSADGYILTNNHVVEGANELTVVLHDRRELKAEVVGRDKDSDIAVLKVNASGLVPAPFGDSDQVAVGQWVLAIGTPMNLRQSVTAGIISATGRAVGITEGGFEDFLQTDAAINPGNSGGPLVNLQGEVIGINTAIASRTGGFMGIGFAIPSNMARGVMEQILKQGKVVRGRIGAVVSDISEDIADKFGYASHDGAFVQDVLPDGPAAKAGLEAGDIVTRFQGHEIKTSNQFRNAVAATSPGTRSELQIIRDSKPKTISVEIAELENGQQIAAGRSSGSGEADVVTELGLTVQALTPEIARQLNLKEARGLVITQVEPGSLAQRTGLEAGDVITSINRQRVDNLNDYRAALKASSLEKGVMLQIRRDGLNRFVVIRSR